MCTGKHAQVGFNTYQQKLFHLGRFMFKWKMYWYLAGEIVPKQSLVQTPILHNPP